MSTANHYPDGYTEQAVDALLAELDAAVTVAAPTSALLSGQAAYRARRRAEQRALTSTVRALPVRAALAASQDGEAA